LRGSWADRLAEIDADIAAIAAKMESAKPAQTSGPIARAIAEALSHPQRTAVAARHTTPASFQLGSPLSLEFAAVTNYASVQLHYRHVNHAERWQSEPMQSDGRLWRAAIPAEYTQSQFALQYYFEVKEAPGSAALYPGFGEENIARPYFVVRKRSSRGSPSGVGVL